LIIEPQLRVKAAIEPRHSHFNLSTRRRGDPVRVKLCDEPQAICERLTEAEQGGIVGIVQALDIEKILTDIRAIGIVDDQSVVASDWQDAIPNLGKY